LRAPGFMLTPASQAKNLEFRLFAQSFLTVACPV
jgi:hypothetical protein